MNLTTLRSSEVGDWPEGEEDWEEVALSFLESSQCDTPVRNGGATRAERASTRADDIVSKGVSLLSLANSTSTPAQHPSMVEELVVNDEDKVEIKTDGATGTDRAKGAVDDKNKQGVSLNQMNLDKSTTTPAQHPSMVEGLVVGEDNTEGVGCVYDDKGVCSRHGQATKEWRGGRKWGRRKNGMFGWNYTRKNYWVCEKVRKTTDPVEEPEPTFIYMGGSKDTMNLSRGYTTRRRFGDF